MDILLLRGFNNYFNRIVKKYTTLADYKSHSVGYLEFTGVNFNPNDGVATELILGSPAQQESSAPLAWDQLGTPDYLICSETVNSTTTIKFRWFVLESERTRDGQYRLALKRDVIVDHLDEVMNATCFVEKGSIIDSTDPLLLNSEGSSVNQIKKDEILLQDETKCAWLAAYIKKDAVLPAGDNPITAYIGVDETEEPIIDASTLPFKDCINYPGATASKHFVKDNSLNVAFAGYDYNSTSLSRHYIFNLTSQGGTTCVFYEQSYGGNSFQDYTLQTTAIKRHTAQAPDHSPYYENVWNIFIGQTSTEGSALFNEFHTRLINSGNFVNGGSSTSVANIYNTYNGKYIKYNNKIYQLQISYMSSADLDNIKYNISMSMGAENTWSNYCSWMVNQVLYGAWVKNTDDYNNISGVINFTPDQGLIFNAVEVASNSIVQYTVPASGLSGRDSLLDELYDLILFPYNPKETVEFYDHSGTLRVLSNDASTAIANKLITSFGTGDTGYSIDIQLLPYCPIEFPITNGKMDLRELEATANYTEIITQADNTPKSFALYVKHASFTKNINITSGLYSFSTNTALNKKLNSECCLTRLTSPNFNGSFELKKAKLNSGIIYVNVDCTYKPFSPYIKLNPNFDGLYGADWNDSTGLILGGDFSLPILTDAWTQYQLSNKNYQQMFDRQIQNLDINNQIAMEKQQWSAAIGVLTGGIGGGIGGAMTGAKTGVAGAIIGAGVGLTAGFGFSAAGAQKDADWLLRQQGEARSYAIDMYNYQLGNIKALPQSISKSSPLTFNNKIWPILEEFRCTDTEAELIKSKLEYNGMTIMAIGTLGQYSISNVFDKVYVKGQLIRCETIADDFHIIDAIYQEVNKGFYIPQGV